MTKPLALLFYSNLMPGSRLITRLEELGYRVLTVGQISSLQEVAKTEKPLVALAEVSSQGEVLSAISTLKADAATRHIPVLAYSAEHSKQLQETALKAGVSLLASSSAVLEQLPQLLDQVLEV